MEQLLHYTWHHRLFPLPRLRTTDGAEVEVVDVGLPNANDGPDFSNAKVRIGGQLWAGNVEIHERASDWQRHGHHTDRRYDSVVLHVVGVADAPAVTSDGRPLPQLELPVPPQVQGNYDELLRETAYPPCWRLIAQLPRLKQRAWLTALAAERLEAKTERLTACLERTCGDWERTAFVALARAFGFGTNADAFEEWAFRILPAQVGKHRDDQFQVEAFFFGQAGLLGDTAVPPERRDDYFLRLQREYAFLRHKFDLSPMDARLWRFMRLRPHNFPHVRLAQLASLYCRRKVDLSRLLETPGADGLRELLRTGVEGYWAEHYAFGTPSRPASKTLQRGSLDLLLINAVAPLFFAYGKERLRPELCERAVSLLESLPAERNTIIRAWESAGLPVATASDSQALLQLQLAYCRRKDCLRCRFGVEYLRRPAPTTPPRPLDPYPSSHGTPL